MIRTFDLSVFEENVHELLNNERLRLISLNVSCSEETGYTVATLHLAPCEPRERRFERYLKRFILFESDTEIDEILHNKENRLIKKYIFPTSEGTIIVLDYNVRRVG